MPKITHIITGLNVGGAERALHNLLTGGLQDYCDNRVISLTGEGHYGPLLRSVGIPVTCLNMAPGRPTPGAVLRLRRAVREAAPNIIQGWMYHGNLAASLARRLATPQATLVWNVRRSLESEDALKASTRAIINLGARFSTRPGTILYNSSRARAQHEARGYASARGQVIANGFDLQRWAPNPDCAHRLRREAGLPDGARIVGFVGRGHADKDIPNLLSAFRQVATADAAAHLVCVGRDTRKPNSGPRGDERVVYLGQRDDVERILPAFDVLCLSSSVEGFPNVIGEAMACGVPCVTTDVGDAAAIVADTGWIVPPRDSKALARALVQALAASPGERRARGEAARARIETHYSLGAAVEQYRALYERLSVTV